MTVVAAPRPIPGRLIDPEPKETPDIVVKLDAAEGASGTAAGVGYRAMARFTAARTTLLSAGTTYYVFLALFSLIALGYGVTALMGADEIADYLTRALSEAFPGLLGDEGLDPDRLRSIGQTASIIGLLAMLYSGSGAMVAANASIHQIYGAPPDPRNYVLKRVRLLLWLVVIGPLIAVSFVVGYIALKWSSELNDFLGWEGTQNRIIATVMGMALTLLVDFLVVFLMLAYMGGIRPPTRPLIIGSIVGALAIQLLRLPMGLILKISADKPEYGALTLPIGVLLVLYLNAMALYGAAALTAGIAERDVPLEDLVPVLDPDDLDPDSDTDDTDSDDVEDADSDARDEEPDDSDDGDDSDSDNSDSEDADSGDSRSDDESDSEEPAG